MQTVQKMSEPNATRTDASMASPAPTTPPYSPAPSIGSLAPNEARALARKLVAVATQRANAGEHALARAVRREASNIEDLASRLEVLETKAALLSSPDVHLDRDMVQAEHIGLRVNLSDETKRLDTMLRTNQLAKLLNSPRHSLSPAPQKALPPVHASLPPHGRASLPPPPPPPPPPPYSAAPSRPGRQTPPPPPPPPPETPQTAAVPEPPPPSKPATPHTPPAPSLAGPMPPLATPKHAAGALGGGPATCARSADAPGAPLALPGGPVPHTSRGTPAEGGGGASMSAPAFALALAVAVGIGVGAAFATSSVVAGAASFWLALAVLFSFRDRPCDLRHTSRPAAHELL